MTFPGWKRLSPERRDFPRNKTWEKRLSPETFNQMPIWQRKLSVGNNVGALQENILIRGNSFRGKALLELFLPTTSVPHKQRRKKTNTEFSTTGRQKTSEHAHPVAAAAAAAAETAAVVAAGAAAGCLCCCCLWNHNFYP